MIITIDGSSGAGKTTVAKYVAKRLGFSYFDTGAMYRAFTWLVLKKKIALTDLEEIKKALENFDFHIKSFAKESHYFLENQDITEEIRNQNVTHAVSAVSALPIVRETLWKLQRSFGAEGNSVFEGRDMGTVVFPHAELKIFLTAKEEIRAERRFDELANKNKKRDDSLNYEATLQDMIRRDSFDSKRELAPLKCPEDAYIIDTSQLNIEEVVEIILKYHALKCEL